MPEVAEKPARPRRRLASRQRPRPRSRPPTSRPTPRSYRACRAAARMQRRTTNALVKTFSLRVDGVARTVTYKDGTSGSAASSSARMDRFSRSPARGARLRDRPHRPRPGDPLLSEDCGRPAHSCSGSSIYTGSSSPACLSPSACWRSRRSRKLLWPAPWAPPRRRCWRRCGQSSEMLIASRALMGVSGDDCPVHSVAHLHDVPGSEAAHYRIGFWIAAYSAGGAIGPVVGGIPLELFWWGAVFLIGVPVMALLLFLGPRTLPGIQGSERRPLGTW